VGRDDAANNENMAVLYLSLDAETAIGELIRHLTPELIPRLNGYQLSEVTAELAEVIDCRDPACAGLNVAALCDDFILDAPRALAHAAWRAGAEGLIVPSATRLGDNLILFPGNLSTASGITVISHRDPRLFVQRDAG
jgi:RES domain-containing protein